MQAELLVGTFVKVNNTGTLLATQKARDERRNVLIFLAASLLLVEKRICSLGWLLWVKGKRWWVCTSVHLLFLKAWRHFSAHAGNG